MYAIKKSLYLSVSAIILCGGSGNVFASGLPQTTHTRHISLSDSAPSYQIASIQWLPDALEEGLKFSGFSSGGTDGGHGKGDGCDSKYNLSQCPDKGKCDRCAFANKYYLKGCDNGYKVNTTGLACVELSDTCPSGYYKSCSTGTTGTPKYTEKGTACYQCKVLSDTCPSGYYKSCSTGTTGTPKYTEKGTACYQCKVLSDTCPSGYYKSCSTGTTGTPKYTEKGTACYQCKSSTSTPSKPSCSGGIYDSSNCPDGTHALCGVICNKKYPSCVKRPYPDMSDSDKTINYYGWTFTAKRDFSNCPDYTTNSDFYKFTEEFGKHTYSLPSIKKQTAQYYYACYSGDRACIDAYLKFEKNKAVTLEKDINCGNLGWYLKDSGTYTINGNDHNMTFDMTDTRAFNGEYGSTSTLKINNAKIIYKNSNSSKFVSDVCLSSTINDFLFRGDTMLTNVDIDISGNTNATTYGATHYGASNIKIGKGVYDAGTSLSEVYGTVNLLISKDAIPPTTGTGKVSISVNVKDGGVANIMTEHEAMIYIKGEGNFKVNICSKKGAFLYKSGENTPDLKERVRSNVQYDSNSTYVPNICSESIFSGSFWK